jgi:hypothetical protein
LRIHSWLPHGALGGSSGWTHNLEALLTGNVYTEIFGSLEAITPGMAQVEHTPHLPQGPDGSGPPSVIRAKRDYRRLGSQSRELA